MARLFLFYPFHLIILWLHFRRTGLGFIRCKGLLSRLILRLEVHSLQILPFRERVIGRESHRMKLYRQPFTASIKFQGGSDGKEPTRGKRKKCNIKIH